MYEGKQVLECSELVTIGRNCVIDSHAIIHGPTTIGDNVTINAGAIIENLHHRQQCKHRPGLPINAFCRRGWRLFAFPRFCIYDDILWTTALIAQNTCLQMCVIGRDTFIGAGSTFTDFHLLSAPIHARDGNDQLNISNRPVLGGCVGHNCRIGSGLVVYPARTIESDVIIIPSNERREIIP